MFQSNLFSSLIFTFLVLSLTLSIIDAYIPNTSSKIRIRSSNSLLWAKKKSKKTNTKGFGSTKVPESKSVPINVTTADIVNKKGEDAIPQAIEAEVNDVDAIFRKYGMDDEAAVEAKRKEAAAVIDPEKKPFGQDVMAGLSGKQQQQFESILVTGCFASLLFCVLCGIGISLGAFKIVFPTIEVPESIDFLIKNFLDPAFTPSIGIFFFFSITYGTFKFAQISSEATVYREN